MTKTIRSIMRNQNEINLFSSVKRNNSLMNVWICTHHLYRAVISETQNDWRSTIELVHCLRQQLFSVTQSRVAKRHTDNDFQQRIKQKINLAHSVKSKFHEAELSATCSDF